MNEPLPDVVPAIAAGLGKRLEQLEHLQFATLSYRRVELGILCLLLLVSWHLVVLVLSFNLAFARLICGFGFLWLLRGLILQREMFFHELGDETVVALDARLDRLRYPLAGEGSGQFGDEGVERPGQPAVPDEDRVLVPEDVRRMRLARRCAIHVGVT